MHAQRRVDHWPEGEWTEDVDAAETMERIVGVVLVVLASIVCIQALLWML